MKWTFNIFSRTMCIPKTSTCSKVSMIKGMEHTRGCDIRGWHLKSVLFFMYKYFELECLFTSHWSWLVYASMNVWIRIWFLYRNKFFTDWNLHLGSTSMGTNILSLSVCPIGHDLCIHMLWYNWDLHLGSNYKYFELECLFTSHWSWLVYASMDVWIGFVSTEPDSSQIGICI